MTTELLVSQLRGSEVADDSALLHGRAYDPVAAREYYLRTRKLKGRKKGSQDDNAVDADRAGRATLPTPAPKKSKKTRNLQAETSARTSAINAKLDKLKGVLEQLIAESKNRKAESSKSSSSDSSSSSSSSSSSKSGSSSSKPKTAAQKAADRKYQKEKYEEEKKKKPADMSQEELDEKIAQVREQIRRVRETLANARTSTSKSSNG